jgi:hypothetical protein
MTPSERRKQQLLRASLRLKKAEDVLARAQLSYWELYARCPAERRILALGEWVARPSRRKK